MQIKSLSFIFIALMFGQLHSKNGENQVVSWPCGRHRGYRVTLGLDRTGMAAKDLMDVQATIMDKKGKDRLQWLSSRECVLRTWAFSKLRPSANKICLKVPFVVVVASKKMKVSFSASALVDLSRLLSYRGRKEDLEEELEEWWVRTEGATRENQCILQKQMKKSGEWSSSRDCLKVDSTAHLGLEGFE